jgi:DNA-binding transcriptional LysR family regulator
MNLLVVFMVVYEERSVSRAATRLQTGQPAVSNSLAKLRALTGDRLFIFRCRMFQPTKKAILLADMLSACLPSGLSG